MKKNSTTIFTVMAVFMMAIITFTTNAQNSSKDYCIPAGDTNGWFYLEDFSFAGIENLGSGASATGYTDYTGMQASVAIGQSYTVSLRVAPYIGNVVQVANMWIDLNGDEVFDANELVLKNAYVDSLTHEYEVYIPGYAVPGVTRLRVVEAWEFANLWEMPCGGESGFGEWEDYSVEITGTSRPLDAAALSIDMFPAIYQPGDVTPVATVVNYGSEQASFDVSCTVDGTAYSSTVTTAELAPGEQTQLTFDSWSAANADLYTMNISTSLIGDVDPTNDIFSGFVNIVDEFPSRRVYCEEGTGTWCGWCVRGIVAMEYMRETYPDTWIGVAVHNVDPMQDDEWNMQMGFFMFPNASINRSVVDDVSIEILEGYYEAALQESNYASIEITNFSIDEDLGTVTIEVETEFFVEAENLRLSAAIIENGVTGETSGYDQANYYAGGANGPMGGFEDLTDPVPAFDMVYNEVGRKIIGGFPGVVGSLPEKVEIGVPYTYTFTQPVDESWDINNIEPIALIIEEQGAVVNAAKYIHEVGINETVADINVQLWPNPAKENIYINSENKMAHVSIFNSMGQVVLEENVGANQTQINISKLQSGLYLVKVVNENGPITKPLVVK